ncbi:MAG TPA: hypothetical protein VMW69_16280 [Spirochaetia bacterium]|nr:hypothetical protein [Spirochaetia bacterium]
MHAEIDTSDEQRDLRTLTTTSALAGTYSFSVAAADPAKLPGYQIYLQGDGREFTLPSIPSKINVTESTSTSRST